MKNMMPRCMSMMFSELDPEARRSLAEAMLQRMMDELKGQRDAAAPAAPAAAPAEGAAPAPTSTEGAAAPAAKPAKPAKK